MRLTTAQKREICKLYYSGEKTKSELAKTFNVSHTAISKILDDEKVSKSFKSLIEETTEKEAISMIAFMESKSGQAQELIAIALNSVKAKIAKASLKDTMTAIEKLSTLFKTNDTDGVNGNANELKIVVEKRIVDLTKDEDNGDDTI